MMKKHGTITDKIFESVDVKDSFVPMPMAAMTWTAAPQSMDATEAIHPIVFASMTRWSERVWTSIEESDLQPTIQARRLRHLGEE